MATRDPDCIFCKILEGQIPSARIYEDDQVFAFMDINPLAPGHALVIPKDHYVLATDMPAEAMAALGAVLPKLSRAVMQATEAEGFNLYQTNGKCAGQAVDHVHFHIVPRTPGDRIGFRWKDGKYDEDEMEMWRQKVVREIT